MGNSGFRTHAGSLLRRGNPACSGGPGGIATLGGPFSRITPKRHHSVIRAPYDAPVGRGAKARTSGQGNVYVTTVKPGGIP